MTDTIIRFYNIVESVGCLKQSTLFGLFMFYLTIEQGVDAVTSTRINECFLACELTLPTTVIVQYLVCRNSDC